MTEHVTDRAALSGELPGAPSAQAHRPAEAELAGTARPVGRRQEGAVGVGEVGPELRVAPPAPGRLPPPGLPMSPKTSWGNLG